MKLRSLAAVFAFALLLSGCSAGGGEAVTGIKFERGHGSAWGNQFYIEVNAEEIVIARYIPAGTTELRTVEHLPITETRWQSLCAAVERLPLKKARSLLGESHKLDGGEYRNLTLLRDGKETAYRWPDTPEAQQLEQLLEALVPIESEADQ